MTERGRASVERDPIHLQIGPSSMRWQSDGALVIDIDEIAVPWPSRVRGVVRLHPAQRFEKSVPLASGHRWCPIAPRARVEVELQHPSMKWSGPGYLDCNHGGAPLESAFSRWHWSRAHLSGGRSVVLYDVDRHGDVPLSLGLQFDADGNTHEIESPSKAALPSTLWGIERTTRCDAEAQARVVKTLTDAPFYARSLIGTQWLGERVVAMHESLSLTRFDTRWVQAMLPFRMPRYSRTQSTWFPLPPAEG